MEYALSYFHSASTLAETGAAIFTDIPGCQRYDLLAGEVGYSYPVFKEILRPLLDKVDVNDIACYRNQIHAITALRNHVDFEKFCNRVYALSCRIFRCDRGDGERERRYGVWLKNICLKLKQITHGMGEIRDSLTPESVLHYMDVLEQRIKEEWYGERMPYMMETKKRVNIVIITVNDVEHQAAVMALDRCGMKCVPVIHKSNVYLQACTESTDFYIVRSMPGSVGAGSAVLTVHDAILDLHPSAIIAGGVAFGCKKESQTIGDILISRQVWQYDPQKKTETAVIRRGDKATASPRLYQRFLTAATLWKMEHPGISLHTGVVASGEVLSNDPAFVEELKQSEPEIIGGEMEGAGVLSASVHENCDWIVVKAICDWGAKKSDNFQPEAAENSYEFIFDVLRQFPLTE